MASEKITSIVGTIVGLAILIIGAVLVGITKFASVNTNPYLSDPSKIGIVYGVIFGVGFVVFVTFLTLFIEARSE